MGWIDVRTEELDDALLCLNGHIVNSHLRSATDQNLPYCPRCGEKTISACPECNRPIPGHATNEGGYLEAPAYCCHCGEPYPWTERTVQAVLELAADDLNADEQAEFEASLRDAMVDSPRAEVGATLLKRFMTRIRAESVKVLRGLLINVVSETAKRTLFP